MYALVIWCLRSVFYFSECWKVFIRQDFSLGWIVEICTFISLCIEHQFLVSLGLLELRIYVYSIDVRRVLSLSLLVSSFSVIFNVCHS